MWMSNRLFVEAYIVWLIAVFVDLAIKDAINGQSAISAYDDRLESLIESCIIAKISLFGDLTTNMTIKLKYDVMRVYMKIDVIEMNKTRNLKILKMKKLLLPKID